MRRLFWVALGLGFGATGAIMTSRWTRRQMQRAKPQTIAREARGGLLDLSKLVAESVEEGKRAADERERELRAKHEIPGPGAH
jgi:sensor histidine kinase regulating citrate/malate metabolism